MNEREGMEEKGREGNGKRNGIVGKGRNRKGGNGRECTGRNGGKGKRRKCK